MGNSAHVKRKTLTNPYSGGNKFNTCDMLSDDEVVDQKEYTQPMQKEKDRQSGRNGRRGMTSAKSHVLASGV